MSCSMQRRKKKKKSSEAWNYSWQWTDCWLTRLGGPNLCSERAKERLNQEHHLLLLRGSAGLLQTHIYKLVFHKHIYQRWERQPEPAAGSSPRAEAENNPIYIIKWELLNLAVLFQYLHQYSDHWSHHITSEHWGDTALVFQTVLCTDEQKAWGKNPQAVGTQLKYHPLCP